MRDLALARPYPLLGTVAGTVAACKLEFKPMTWGLTHEPITPQKAKGLLLWIDASIYGVLKRRGHTCNMEPVRYGGTCGCGIEIMAFYFLRVFSAFRFLITDLIFLNAKAQGTHSPA